MYILIVQWEGKVAKNVKFCFLPVKKGYLIHPYFGDDWFRKLRFK